MTSWRSYDAIAGQYESLWTERFERAASHLLEVAAADSARRLLDIGTGTGAVPGALGSRRRSFDCIVGCDLSRAMLALATRKFADLHAVVADAARLPFCSDSFDIVTANCVLSHLQDHRVGLLEARRVLQGGSLLALSNWGPASDPYQEAWSGLLAAAVGAGAAERASQEVAPSEARLASPESLKNALEEAGFVSVRVALVSLPLRMTTEEFLAERALSSGGRFARFTLGESRWEAFESEALVTLRGLFGAEIAYARGLVVGAGRKA